jgi:hypothetical protein
MSAACTVWFYSPAKDRVTGLNVINKIVAGLDPPFCHTELQRGGLLDRNAGGGESACADVRR